MTLDCLGNRSCQYFVRRFVKLTEEHSNVLDSSDHGLEPLELDLLDDVVLVAAAPVLDEPLQDVILGVEGALVQDGDGVAVVDQGRQLPQIVFCHLKLWIV